MPDTHDPIEGSVGYLTWAEFDRLERAVVTAQRHVPWWRVAGYVKIGADPDELRMRTAPAEFPIGLPATYLAADTVTSLMHELNQWPELEDAARDDWGSELCRQFTREVETAAAKWPLDDRPRKVKFFRCQACDQMTLRYFPPKDGDREDAPRVVAVVRGTDGRMRSADLMDSVIRCTDKTCAAVVDQEMFMRMAIMAEAERKERDGVRRVGSARGSEDHDREVAVHDLPVGDERVGSVLASVESVVVQP